MTVYSLEIESSLSWYNYSKRQSEYSGPASLWPEHNIQKMLADADTIFIIPEWFLEELYVQMLLYI